MSDLIYTEGCPHPSYVLEVADAYPGGPTSHYATCRICGRTGDDAATPAEAVAALRAVVSWRRENPRTDARQVRALGTPPGGDGGGTVRRQA